MLLSSEFTSNVLPRGLAIIILRELNEKNIYNHYTYVGYKKSYLLNTVTTQLLFIKY